MRLIFLMLTSCCCLCSLFGRIFPPYYLFLDCFTWIENPTPIVFGFLNAILNIVANLITYRYLVSHQLCECFIWDVFSNIFMILICDRRAEKCKVFVINFVYNEKFPWKKGNEQKRTGTGIGCQILIKHWGHI